MVYFVFLSCFVFVKLFLLGVRRCLIRSSGQCLVLEGVYVLGWRRCGVSDCIELMYQCLDERGSYVFVFPPFRCVVL
jgi:hypothetical protein